MFSLKRLFMLILISLLTFVFVACSEGDSSDTDAATGEGTEESTSDVTDTENAEDTEGDNTDTPVVTDDMILYYNMTTSEKNNKKLLDMSGNGNDGIINGNSYEITENGELYITDGTYVKIANGTFDGSDTLTISLWLNNYTGNGNYSAMYIGTKESLPTGYWLLNPCNPSGKLKSVITNSKDASAPYNTEVGISATKQTIEGPATSIGWNLYTTVLTDSSIPVYFNGELVGTHKTRRSISDFGDGLVAYLGRSSYDDPTYSGFIKEVKVYSRVLTEDEIKAEYAANKPADVVYADSEYENPLIEERADPYVIKGNDGYYYFTASYPQRGGSDSEGYDRIILRRSETLEGLSTAEEITIWDEKDSTTCHRYIWAPELHYIGGKWYIYFAGSTSGTSVWDIRCFVLECDSQDPYTGNWTLRGRFQASAGDTFSFSGFSLDMTYFEHNGEHYVIWAQKGSASDLYMATIDPEKPWRLTSKPLTLSVPEYYWEKARYAVCEGPAVLIHGDKVFVFYSAAGTGPEYCVGLLMADAASDLMKKSSWTKLSEPILTSTDLEGEYGPGHNSFTTDEEGNVVFVYHARSEECFLGQCGFAGQDPLVDPCRHARMRRVLWTADGMPILNSVAE